MFGAGSGPRVIDLGNPVADHPLNYGMVTWALPLPHLRGGKLMDLKGGKHGTFTNGPTWTSGNPGGFGAVNFAAGTDYVDFGTAHASTLSGSFTVSMWVYIRGAAGQNIFGNRGTSHSRQLEYSIQVANRISTVQEGVSSIQGVVFNTFLNSWKHITWTYNVPTTTSVLYFDGLQVSSVSYTFTAAYAGSSFLSDDSANRLDGKTTDLRIYNRALSASEALGVFNQSRAGHPDTLRRYQSPLWSFGTVASAPPPSGGYKVISGMGGGNLIRGAPELSC